MLWEISKEIGGNVSISGHVSEGGILSNEVFFIQIKTIEVEEEAGRIAV